MILLIWVSSKVRNILRKCLRSTASPLCQKLLLKFLGSNYFGSNFTRHYGNGIIRMKFLLLSILDNFAHFSILHNQTLHSNSSHMPQLRKFVQNFIFINISDSIFKSYKLTFLLKRGQSKTKIQKIFLI